MANDFEVKTKITLGGDKEYRASMKAINDSLKMAKSNMAAATSAFDKNDKSVSALQTRMDSLRGVYDAQQSKVELLRAKMEKLRSEGKDNTDAYAKLQISLNNATAAMNKTGLELAKTSTELEEAKAAEAGAGDAAEELGNDAADAAKGLEKEADAAEDAEEKSGGFGKKIASVAADIAKVSFVALTTGLAAVGAAAAAATKEMFEFAKGAGTYADNLLTLSTQTGVATDDLQKWSYASNFVDTSVETITGSMRKMTMAMGDAADGSKSAQAKFDALGVSVKDSSGSMRDGEDVFWDAIEALGNVANETERDALAMDLFGKSAQELNPLIEAGRAQFEALGAEAESMGVVFSGEAINAMGAFDDSMQRVKAAGEGLKNAIGLTVIPAFQPFVDTASSAMAQVSTALQDGLQPGELEAISASLIETLTGMLTEAGGMITQVVGVAGEALAALGATLAEQLPGMLEVLLPAAMGLMQSLVETITANTEPLIGLATSVITSLANFLIENLPQLATAAISILLGLVDGITEHLPELIPLAVTMIVELATALIGALPELIARLPEICSAIFEGLSQVDWISLGLNLIQGLVDGLTSAVSSLLSAITGVFKSIWQAILGVFGIASPSTEAASAAGFIFQGLLDGFEAGVSAVCDAVKRIFGKIWDAIKSIFGFGGESEESKDAKQAGEDIMGGIKTGVTGSEDDVKDAVQNAAKNVLKMLREGLGVPEGGGDSTKTNAYGAGLITGMRAGIASANSAGYAGAADKAGADALSAFNTALSIKGGAAGKFKDVGKAIAEGIAQGITKNESKIKTAAKNAAKSAYEEAKTALDINSPSKVMMKIGAGYDEGFALGIKRNMAAVKDAAAALSAEAAGATESAVRRAQTAQASAGVQSAGGSTAAQVINVQYMGPFTRSDARGFGRVLAGSLQDAAYALGG